MSRRLELAGKRFGRLLVCEFAGSLDRCSRWLCKCDCGNECTVRGPFLVRGHTASCGCISKDRMASMAKTASIKHGKSRTREYKAWNAMLSRCYNPRYTQYADYGGRGVSVCEKWHTYEGFVEDMGERPGDEYSIDRIDTNGNYEPRNCRWLRRSLQNRNKRNNTRLTCRGMTLLLIEWSEYRQIHLNKLCRRLKSGWPLEEVLGYVPHRPIRRRAAAC